MNNHPKIIIINVATFMQEIFNLLKSPVFLSLSVLGNSIIAVFSFIFYQIELGTNPYINSFLDALWWGFATATTTGYGDIVPVTAAGKILSILLMLTGLAFFGIFTALFAETILVNGKDRFQQ